MSNDKPSIADRMKAAAAEGAAKAAAEQKAPTPRRVEGYKGNHVKRLVLRNGVIVLPNEDGVFIPKSQEEYDMLEHLAASATCSLEKLFSAKE